MATTDYRDLLEEARRKLNDGDVDGYVDTLYAQDAELSFLPPGLPSGREGARMFYKEFQHAFPDLKLTIDDTVLQEDWVVIRFHTEMTHLGDFSGIPATGKRVGLKGITGMRFADGQVVERWNQADFLGLMQQLGVA